jgi:hypothetical protein
MSAPNAARDPRYFPQKHISSHIHTLSCIHIHNLMHTHSHTHTNAHKKHAHKQTNKQTHTHTHTPHSQSWTPSPILWCPEELRVTTTITTLGKPLAWQPCPCLCQQTDMWADRRAGCRFHGPLEISGVGVWPSACGCSVLCTPANARTHIHTHAQKHTHPAYLHTKKSLHAKSHTHKSHTQNMHTHGHAHIPAV